MLNTSPLADDCKKFTMPYPGPTIFVVDDDNPVRSALARLLRVSGWMVETYSSAGEFLAREKYSGVGCVLLDSELPLMSGIELQAHMASNGCTLPVIFLTAKGDIPTSVLAMKQGAVDFLVKPVEEGVLLTAIQQAISRHVALLTQISSRNAIMECVSRLSPRERDVLKLVCAGRMNKQIASALGIAEKTVKVHRGRVMEKMKAESVAQLIHMCGCIST